MSKRFLTLLAGALALAAFAVGCGSGGDEETTTLTKTAYVKQANSICRKLNEENAARYEAFFKKHAKASNAELKATVSQIYLPSIEARLEGLKEIPLPATDANEVEAMIAALEEGIDKVPSVNPIPFQTTQEVFEEANKLALSYGLTYCYSA